MLLKVQTLERLVLKQTEINKKSEDYIALENQLAQLYTLGYREMPIEMQQLFYNDSVSFTKDYTPKGFQTLEDKTPYITLSNGKFEEVHTKKAEETYFNTVFDTKTKKIRKIDPKLTAENINTDLVVFALSIDPLQAEFSWNSPYAFSENRLIDAVELEGLEKIHFSETVKNGVTWITVTTQSDVEGNLVDFEFEDKPSNDNHIRFKDYGAVSYSNESKKVNNVMKNITPATSNSYLEGSTQRAGNPNNLTYYKAKRGKTQEGAHTTGTLGGNNDELRLKNQKPLTQAATLELIEDQIKIINERNEIPYEITIKYENPLTLKEVPFDKLKKSLEKEYPDLIINDYELNDDDKEPKQIRTEIKTITDR